MDFSDAIRALLEYLGDKARKGVALRLEFGAFLTKNHTIQSL